ncbi:hypothetical protein H072_7088 [Dactylellina haptotyla CBS 200.50]|uniref:Rhodopsin domain-containing protein n=1 Tax=Dactylellina haptotyla (strain CBS 200.50) TaxID=1284197 RepID=S8A8D3_DACHA|nr:hypothetical protein H072_7088 [Dactylellina haptotyla CBS 200.50]
MLQPPNHQTDADREYLTSLFPYFKQFPSAFEFPLVTDPDYKIPCNSLYCLLVGGVVAIVGVVVASLRFWIRTRTGFGMDDWLMVPAFISFCVFIIVNCIAVLGTGMGFHLYDLSIKDIESFILIKYIHVVVWFCVLHFCRCSIIHLLLRLTPLQLPMHRRYIISILVISYLYLLVCIFTHMFECGIPLSNSFKLKASIDGTCIGAGSLTLYGSLISGHIALDILTIAPPVFVLSNIPMSRTKKINLITLLAFGVFTMFCSMIRIFCFYRKMVESFDITWTATDVAFWSTLECSLACIIASLPALNHLIVKYIRRTLNKPEALRDIPNRLGIIKLTQHRTRSKEQYAPKSTIFETYNRYMKYGAKSPNSDFIPSSAQKMNQKSENSRSQTSTTESEHNLDESNTYTPPRRSLDLEAACDRTNGEPALPPPACIYEHGRRTSIAATNDLMTHS